MIALMLLMGCDVFKPETGTGGNWDSFEDQVWTVTGLTDQAGGPGLHPWGVIEDCGGLSETCTTCFEMADGTLTVWTSTGLESSTDYEPLGGLLTYRVGDQPEPTTDSGDSDPPAELVLDGEVGADWILTLEADAYQRRIVDFWDRTSRQDRMWVQAGCPVMAPR